MNATTPGTRPAADLNVQRWFWRMIGYGVITVASAAWLVRDEQPFWPAFALQVVASAVFVALILLAIVVGVMVGVWVGKLNGFLGVIVGLVVGAALFLFAGIFSTEIPVLGPAIERIVALIE